MTPEQAAKLREPFPDQHISVLQIGGKSLSYINHAIVTSRLLEIDPSWSWEPVAFDDRGLPALDDKGGLWIRLTICGVTRYGYGEPQGQNHYDRVKGAISNAIRVGAMRFGVGIDLWSKEDMTVPVEAQEVKPEPDFEIVRPVANDRQVAAWTAAISEAPDFMTLKKIADEISGYHLAEELQSELLDIWSMRRKEITGGAS